MTTPRTPAMNERLGTTRFAPDGRSHIEVDSEALIASGAADAVIAVCPAGVYRRSGTEGGQVVADAAGCLECGACLAVAPEGTLTWHYPRGGYGVRFRQG